MRLSMAGVTAPRGAARAGPRLRAFLRAALSWSRLKALINFIAAFVCLCLSAAYILCCRHRRFSIVMPRGYAEMMMRPQERAARVAATGACRFFAAGARFAAFHLSGVATVCFLDMLMMGFGDDCRAIGGRSGLIDE